jgi:hypothetical protein
MQTSPQQVESLEDQVFSVDATEETTYAGLYRIISNTIDVTIPLYNELQDKSWKLYHGNKVISDTPKKLVGNIQRETVSSLNISLVVR